MSVARFIADQRTILPGATHAELRAAGRERVLVLQVARPAAHAAAAPPRPNSTPRSRACSRPPGAPTARRGCTPTCVEAGWRVSVNTVADSMRRQGLQGRKPKRRRGLTKQDQSAPKFPDLLNRDFTAAGAEPEVVRRHHRDPHRRGQAVPGHGDRLVLASAAGRATVGAPRRRAGQRGDQDGRRGPRRPRRDRRCDLPHRPRIDLHRNRFHRTVPTAGRIANRWAGSDRASITPPRRRSSPPWNTRSCPGTSSPPRPRRAPVVMAWCHDFYNHRRRHSSAALLSPIEYERLAARPTGRSIRKAFTIRGEAQRPPNTALPSGGSLSIPISRSRCQCRRWWGRSETPVEICRFAPRRRSPAPPSPRVHG